MPADQPGRIINVSTPLSTNSAKTTARTIHTMRAGAVIEAIIPQSTSPAVGGGAPTPTSAGGTRLYLRNWNPFNEGELPNPRPLFAPTPPLTCAHDSPGRKRFSGDLLRQRHGLEGILAVVEHLQSNHLAASERPERKVGGLNRRTASASDLMLPDGRKDLVARVRQLQDFV